MEFSAPPIPAPVARRRSANSDALFADGVRPALFQRASVGRTGMNAIEKRHRFGMPLIEAAARGGGFQRKAHLDVGGGEFLAREPGALAEFALPIGHVLLELRI